MRAGGGGFWNWDHIIEEWGMQRMFFQEEGEKNERNYCDNCIRRVHFVSYKWRVCILIPLRQTPKRRRFTGTGMASPCPRIWTFLFQFPVCFFSTKPTKAKSRFWQICYHTYVLGGEEFLIKLLVAISLSSLLLLIVELSNFFSFSQEISKEQRVVVRKVFNERGNFE